MPGPYATILYFATTSAGNGNMEAFLAFLWFALAHLILSSLSADTCGNQAWTVKDFNVTYGLEVRTGASASFTIINNATSKSDDLTCQLRANSRCEFVGTPSDEGLHIYIQTTIDLLLITVNDTISCNGETT